MLVALTAAEMRSAEAAAAKRGLTAPVLMQIAGKAAADGFFHMDTKEESAISSS